MNNASHSRSSSGNIIIISVTLAVAIILFLVWILQAYWLDFTHEKELTASEKVALAAAKELNKDDTQGEMNFITARGREYLFCCREALAKAEATAKAGAGQTIMQQFAVEVCNKTRSKMQKLDDEKTSVIKVVCSNASNAAKSAKQSAGTPGAATLAGAKTGAVELAELWVSGVTNTPSNVEQPTENKLLMQLDAQTSDNGKPLLDPKTKFYSGNINAKLPDDDADLNFYISSLAPEINGVTTPPRKMNQNDFDPAPHPVNILNAQLPKFLPSAVQALLTVQVSDGKAQHQLRAVGAAACNGGQPPP